MLVAVVSVLAAELSGVTLFEFEPEGVVEVLVFELLTLTVVVEVFRVVIASVVEAVVVEMLAPESLLLSVDVVVFGVVVDV